MSSGANARKGARVRNTETGEIGTVLYAHQWGGLRVQVDVNPDEWRGSVIGPPSSITASWERWLTSTDLNPEPEEAS